MNNEELEKLVNQAKEVLKSIISAIEELAGQIAEIFGNVANMANILEKLKQLEKSENKNQKPSYKNKKERRLITYKTKIIPLYLDKRRKVHICRSNC